MPTRSRPGDVVREVVDEHAVRRVDAEPVGGQRVDPPRRLAHTDVAGQHDVVETLLQHLSRRTRRTRTSSTRSISGSRRRRDPSHDVEHRLIQAQRPVKRGMSPSGSSTTSVPRQRIGANCRSNSSSGIFPVSTSESSFAASASALTVDENPEKYFGALERRAEQKFREVSMPAYVRLAILERALEVDREQLRALNPAWRPTIYNGTRLVPRGYRLRLPADTAEKWTPELLAARLPANELYAGQITPRSHRVRKGETMAAIAQRYGMTAARLAEMNGLSANASLRAGRHLTLPEQVPGTFVGYHINSDGSRRDRKRCIVAGERHGGKRSRRRVLRRSSWRFTRGHCGACQRAAGRAAQDEFVAQPGLPL